MAHTLRGQNASRDYQRRGRAGRGVQRHTTAQSSAYPRPGGSGGAPQRPPDSHRGVHGKRRPRAAPRAPSGPSGSRRPQKPPSRRRRPQELDRTPVATGSATFPVAMRPRGARLRSSEVRASTTAACARGVHHSTNQARRLASLPRAGFRTTAGASTRREISPHGPHCSV